MGLGSNNLENLSNGIPKKSKAGYRNREAHTNLLKTPRARKFKMKKGVQ